MLSARCEKHPHPHPLPAKPGEGRSDVAVWKIGGVSIQQPRDCGAEPGFDSHMPTQSRGHGVRAIELHCRQIQRKGH